MLHVSDAGRDAKDSEDRHGLGWLSWGSGQGVITALGLAFFLLC